jgi:uncharacterized protein (TIGR01777 family)
LLAVEKSIFKEAMHMKVFISGGSGFVGVHLSKYFIGKGHRVVASGTSARHPLAGRDNFEYVRADTTKEGAWQNRVKQVDAIINLAGRNIFKYWTRSYKKQIYDSRILTTRRLVEALDESRPAVFFNTSAIGYYGDRGEALLPEDTSAGDDFLARVCVDWEGEALAAGNKGARVVIMRFAVILGKDGGALAKMIPAYRFFMGGPLASGRQWFPWLHVEDLKAAIEFIYENKSMKGPFNFCSPHAVRNKEFARKLGHALNRPAFMKVPAFAVKLFMGEMGGALLSSQKGVPQRLEKFGFQFQYSNLEKALSNIIRYSVGPQPATRNSQPEISTIEWTTICRRRPILPPGHSV